MPQNQTDFVDKRLFSISIQACRRSFYVKCFVSTRLYYTAAGINKCFVVYKMMKLHYFFDFICYCDYYAGSVHCGMDLLSLSYKFVQNKMLECFWFDDVWCGFIIDFKYNLMHFYLLYAELATFFFIIIFPLHFLWIRKYVSSFNTAIYKEI